MYVLNVLFEFNNKLFHTKNDFSQILCVDLYFLNIFYNLFVLTLHNLFCTSSYLSYKLQKLKN